VDVDVREGWGSPQFFSNLLPFRGNGIRGQNIYPTTFAPHVWYLRGKIRVNLLYLPLQPPPLGSLELPLCFRFFSILLLVLGT
jgi:hypothetical protein